jgi:hypothetical protein
VDGGRLTTAEFEKVKIAETIEAREGKSCRSFHSPLWQADADKIRHMAPIEFIGRYLPDGLTTQSVTKSTNSLATRHKVTRSAHWRPVPIGLWG